MRMGAVAVVLWGVGGVVLLLAEAIVRLGMLALRLLRTHSLTTAQTVMLVVWTLLICYAEGYRGFQQRFSPRVVARALYIAAHPKPLLVAFAPLVCMGFFHATRRLLIVSWSLLVGIVGLVVLIRFLPPIYRAIVDVGVALALTWGTAAIVVFLVRALAGKPPAISPDVPGASPSASPGAPPDASL
ncbi:hypothetical protein [Chondromyces apiculatus]|uniref:Uncharacterized protein n=1 Tax=Chondromyces apiculatus DSM 436 TaxID=1192034 RepID=A0A017T0X3_9BACT|nr:hypothetical protein [Chondromyces apiculatus]EYF02904.1 Hypothetical protein CAP_6327 [Chondromyces apiculatus DSM 436]